MKIGTKEGGRPHKKAKASITDYFSKSCVAKPQDQEKEKVRAKGSAPKAANALKAAGTSSKAKRPQAEQSKCAPRKKVKWRRELLESAPEWAQTHVRNLLEEGYTCIRSVLGADLVSEMLQGPSKDQEVRSCVCVDWCSFLCAF